MNPLTTNAGYWKFNAAYILTRGAPLLDRNEAKMDLMLVNVKNGIFHPISTIILLKIFPLRQLIHIKTLVVIYLNPCVALICQRQT